MQCNDSFERALCNVASCHSVQDGASCAGTNLAARSCCSIGVVQQLLRYVCGAAAVAVCVWCCSWEQQTELLRVWS